MQKYCKNYGGTYCCFSDQLCVFWTYIISTEEQDNLSQKITDILHDSNYKLQHMYLISTCLLSINSRLNPVPVLRSDNISNAT